MIFIKTILILTFLLIFYQDLKERLVWWFLFPIIGLTTGILYTDQTSIELFSYNILLNIFFVLLLLLIIFIYAKMKLKVRFKETIGLGDILLFIALTCSFSIISFIVLFIFSLILSLALHLILSKMDSQKSVPLAGYMSLFFAIVYLANWSGLTTNLYSL